MASEKSTMGRICARALLVSSYVFMVVMNMLANSLGERSGVFNHTTVSAVSAQYPTPITPAGYSFGIWGVIWIMTGVFVIYFTVKRSAIDSLPWCAVAAFVVNCVSCGLWVLFFCYHWILVSFIDILFVVGTAAYLYLTFYPGHTSAFPQWSLDYWCRGVTWSLLMAWITIVSFFNLYIVFVAYHVGTSAAAQDAISVIFLAAAGAVGFVMIFVHEDVVSVGVLLWGFVAIAVRHSSNDVVLATSLVVAGACLGLMLFSIVRHVMRSRKGYANITSPKYAPENL